MYTTGNKRLWSRGLVFHLVTGDIFTAGYHADGTDPCVCGSTWFLWMLHLLLLSSWLYWRICTLAEVDAGKIIVHNVSILCVQVMIHNVMHVYHKRKVSDTQIVTSRFREGKWNWMWKRNNITKHRELWLKKTSCEEYFNTFVCIHQIK